MKKGTRFIGNWGIDNKISFRPWILCICKISTKVCILFENLSFEFKITDMAGNKGLMIIQLYTSNTTEKKKTGLKEIKSGKKYKSKRPAKTILECT